MIQQAHITKNSEQQSLSCEGGSEKRQSSCSKRSDFMELIKARLSLLVLITTLVGFLLGWNGPVDWFLLGATLLGTALCAGGASALNQWWERALDALMKRTEDRPLPAKRLHPRDAFLFGLLCCFSGTALLFFFVNILAAFLAVSTIVTYVLIYTPLKQRTTLNTLLGAIPGALPPLIGWAAATNDVGVGGAVLFLILWFWQMPHFLAIAWLYREDYAAAGFRMLSVNDPEGFMTSRQALLYALGLLAVSLLPTLLGMASTFYFAVALILGVLFVLAAFLFVKARTRKNARTLFFTSIIYLPLLLGALVLFKNAVLQVSNLSTLP